MRAAWLLSLVALAACHRPSPSPRSDAAPRATVPQPPAPRLPAPPLPDPLPGVRADAAPLLGGALRGAAADVDGDGRRELALVDAAALRVVTPEGRELGRAPVAGGAEWLDAADVDGDGRDELLAGFGLTVARRDGAARLSLFRLAGGALVEEVVLLPRTSRPDVVALLPDGEPGALRTGAFVDKYTVELGAARRAGGAWAYTPGPRLRMATALGRGDVDGDGRRETVVGRLYGDAQGADGDAFILADDGRRTPLPTRRGVRSLALADSDGDGRPEVFLGDGWDRAYAARAEGRLVAVRVAGGAATAELVESTAGQFTLERLVPADVDGDRRQEIVALGSAYTRVFDWKDGAWSGLTIAGVLSDVVALDADGVPGDELFLLGERPERVSLAAAMR